MPILNNKSTLINFALAREISEDAGLGQQYDSTFAALLAAWRQKRIEDRHRQLEAIRSKATTIEHER